MEDDEDIIEIPLRPLVWMGDSLKNIRSFPEDVRASVGLLKGLEAACMKSSNVTIPILTGQSMQ
jgi:phage-related protein